MMKCATCANKECYGGKDCVGDAERIKEKILASDDYELWEKASRIESEHYMELNRLEETIRLARDMGFKKVGIAFCVGLAREAEVLHKILSRDFQVISVCCKVCGINKEELGTSSIVEGRYEAICNPFAQAELLDGEGSEMNVIVGLCVGHDMLFTKHSKAPVTTLVTKDRVLGHNPVVSLSNRYYQKKMGVI